MDNFIQFLLLSVHVFNAVLSQSCNWPPMFTDTIWHDSNRGEVTFTDSTMSGWDVTALGGDVIEDWECYIKNETSSTTLTLVFKATTTLTLFQNTYIAFACLQMTEFSENAYYYYQMSSEEFRLGYDRLIVRLQSTIVSDPPTVDDLCSSTPTVNEYRVLIRNDKTEAAVRTCPSDYLGSFKYTVFDSISTYCAGGDTSLDVCSNTDTMTFNYSLCSTVLAYSDQGILNCVFDMASVDYHLLTVMTKEITSSQRFTCFMSHLAGNGTLFVSQFPGSCTKLQTPFDIPTSVDGSATGLTMVFTDKEECDTTTTTTSTTSTTTTSTTSTTSTSTTTTTPSTTTTAPPTTSTKETTSTSKTTTTTTATTMLPPTTTTTPVVTTQTLSADSKTAMYIAIVAGCIAGVLLIILILIVVKRFCCREPKPRPKTPNFNIEALPHKIAGRDVMPRRLSIAPRETTIIEEENPDKDIVIFPQAESNDFTMTVPRKPSAGNAKRRNSFPMNPVNPHNFARRMSAVNVPTWESGAMPAIIPSKAPHTNMTSPFKREGSCVAISTQSTDTIKNVKVFDGIIMDETVNYALRYSSRMQNVKQNWYENWNSGTLFQTSEKTVIIPAGGDSSISNSRRVSITDISDTLLVDNDNGNGFLSPINIFDSNTENCIDNTSVSPISEVSLPVSPMREY